MSVKLAVPALAASPGQLEHNLYSGEIRFALLSQALPAELDALGIVDKAIEDGIGKSEDALHVVPPIDGDLACDDDRAHVHAVFDNFQPDRLPLDVARHYAKIRLVMAWMMAQRHKPLTGPQRCPRHVQTHDRVATRKLLFIPQSFKNPLRRLTLLL